MNQIHVDYSILVEVMQEKISAQLNQIVALEARVKVYDNALTEALHKVSEPTLKKTSSRKKTVHTVEKEDDNTF